MVRNQPLSVLLIQYGTDDSWQVPALLSTGAGDLARLTSVANIPDAVAALSGAPVDAILLTLPSGTRDLSLLDQFRAHVSGPPIIAPIIVLGTLDDPDFAAHAMERGAADYLAHGQFDGPLLVRAIRYARARITDLKNMEEALAAERTLLRSLIDSIPDHIYVKDTHHRFMLANLAAQTFLGVSGEELAGKTDSDFFSTDAASSFRWEEEQVLCSGHPSINREECATSVDGKLRWNLTTKVPLRDNRSNVIGLVGINRDITDLKLSSEKLARTNAILERRERELLAAVDDLKRSHEALEATQLQLLQVEKMESVGRLAAGIAHEVKNPLAIISTAIDYLSQKAKGEGSESLGRVFATMSRAVQRADTVIRGLLDFSAPAALCAEPADLNLVIRQALLLVDHELMRFNISLQTELADPLPLVSVDANKIEQVFLNLLINAIQAMPEGGRITLRTRTQQLAALGHNIGDLRAERFRAGDIVVVAEVDDTGHGIPEDKVAKIFDPFFTTKPTGKGTGLGLSVARTIVELHGGMLQLSNRPEGGARAQLVLKATGDSTHDNNNDTDSDPSEDQSLDRGRRAGLHAHDGHGAAADRSL